MEEPAMLCPNDIKLLLEEEKAVFGFSLEEDTDSGQEVQRISVISNLPDLLRDSYDECMRRVVPKVREVLHLSQADMQMAASTAFLQILQNDLVPIQNYTQTFLQTILMSVDSKDPDVANAWLETLLDVIDLLPKDVIKRDILGIAIAKGQLSQSVQSRLACCRILGKVATKFQPFVIQKEILPVVQSLCQDVEYEVRGCMCRQLDPVARGLGLDATKSAILPELVELTNDEEGLVRIAGLETVVSILSLLDDETCTSTLVPLVCKFCEQAMENEDCTLPAVAKQLGRLAHGLSVNLDDEQKQWFVDFYKRICKIGLSEKSKTNKETDQNSPNKLPLQISYLFEEADNFTECRKNAGFNFPAMALFVGTKSFKTDIHSTLTSLCNDSSYHVRKTVASGFHEIGKLLGTSIHLIQPDLITLLKDDSIEVLKGVITHLPNTLELLSKAHTTLSSEIKANLLTEITPAILACDTVISSSNNWRLQAELLEQLACAPRCFTSDHIYNRYVPLLFHKLHTARALPVKHAAASTLLLIMRQNHRLEQRQEICSRLVDEFCHGRSCHQRGLFIDICKLVIQLYSRSFFKDYFFEFIMELATDAVPNIRLRICNILPLLKSQLKLPGDRNLLQLLEQCARKILVNERDRDVTAAINYSICELEKMQVQMDSLTKRNFSEMDVMDQRKEEEEKLLLQLEEKERREEEARSAKSRKEGSGVRRTDSGTSRIPAPRRGSKIPAATSTRGDKGSSASSSNRQERSSSTSGPSGKEVKRTPSFNTVKEESQRGAKNGGLKSTSSSRVAMTGSPRPQNREQRSGSLGSNTLDRRKSSVTSLSSVASSTSSSVTSSTDASRRSSIGALENPLVRKGSCGATRRVSTGSMTSGQSQPPAVKKKLPTKT